MKIKVADIEPNPFRKINQYPIDRSKVEALKTSIKDTSFWDNILARPHPDKKGKYQISYGHHRWIAIQELGFNEIDIPVRQLSDYLMVKIMAEENLNWSSSPAVINETVLAAKEFLNGEFAKYKEFKDLPSVLIDLLEQKNDKSFNKTKSGVGQTTILKFLGGNWKQWKIQEALSVLSHEEEGLIDRKAVESVGTVDKEVVTHKAFIDYGVPVDEQKKIAEIIVEKEVPTKSVRLAVLQNINPKTVKNKNDTMAEMKNLVMTIDEQARSLMKKIKLLRRQMKLLKIEQLKGLMTWLASSSLNLLYKELGRIKVKENQNETNS